MKGEAVALALSGGPDSMALLLILQQQYSHIHALTVDHRLRPESESEAAQVSTWCKSLGVPHTTLVWEHPPLTSGIPEKARDARYTLMTDWCKKNGIKHLFLAHHLDDQVETMVFRLLRGSGIVGLAGMLPEKNWHGITLHRPLLATPKTELIALLTNADHPWINDPTNAHMQYTRNALRVRLQVLTDAQKRRLHAISACFRRFRMGIENRVSEARAECMTEHDCLSHDRFMSQPEEIKTRLLDYLCHQVSNNPTPIRTEKIIRLLTHIESGQGKYMLHGVMFEYQHHHQTWKITLA